MILNGRGGGGGSRLCPQRHLAMTGKFLVVTTWGGEEDILLGDKNTAKHPIMHRVASHHRELSAQNINRTTVEKLWCNHGKQCLSC